MWIPTQDLTRDLSGFATYQALATTDSSQMPAYAVTQFRVCVIDGSEYDKEQTSQLSNKQSIFPTDLRLRRPYPEAPQ
jgi:hypothetical protein